MNESEAARLGVRVRAYRTMRRMTVRGLAGEAGASASFISQLERGQAGASVGMLHRIALALGGSDFNIKVVRGPSLPG